MKNKLVAISVLLMLLISTIPLILNVMAQPPNPVWIDVDKDGEYDPGEPSYTTIQAGVDAASAGQTIYIEPGNYPENVVVHRNVTLKSAEKHEAVVVGVLVGVRTSWAWDVFRVIADGATVEGFHVYMYTPPGFPVMPSPWNGHDGIAVKADGVTVRDNKVEGPGPFTSAVPSTGWGISVIPDDAAPGPEPYPWQTVSNPGEELDGVIIEGNEVRGTTGGGIWTTGTDCLIRKNKVEDTQFTGILLPPWGSKYSHDNLIAENEVKNSGIPILRLDDGIRMGSGATGNTIEANNVSGSSRDGIRAVLATGNTVHYNNIVGNTQFGVRNMDTIKLDARYNWWGDPTGPYHATNPGGLGNAVSNNVDYSPWLGFVVGTSPMTWHVNPTGAPGAIQEAIDEANPGDTIIVYDGTYDEQIVINKSLTIQGGSTPIIKPSSAAILTTVLDGFFWGGTKQIAGIIVANAAGGSVTVKNIIVDGENIVTKPTGADYVAGIFYRETGGTIDTVTVANMTIGSTGTAVRGYGVYLSAITYTVSVEIKYCAITSYDKNAIDVHGDKLTVNIHDNTLTGRGPLPNGDEVQNGVVVMDGATGTVDFNDISNMAYIPETWWSAGIMFLESDGSAEGNIITDCQMGVISQDGSGSAQTNTVAGGTVGLLGLWAQYTTAGIWTATFVGNTISGVRDSPGYENGAIGAQSWDAGSSLVVTIDNNKLLGDGSTSADGIYIGDVPEYDPAGNIQAIITSNTISGWQNGIHLVSSVDAGSILNNNITGTYLGILVENAMSVQICNNRIIDFMRGGIVTRDAKNIFIEGNIISTTLHDEAPNGIDIGTYAGTIGTIRENQISGCSWNGFTGDYETSWSGSGILVIESGDSLQILANIVHDCDVGMDIESDSTNITCSNVHNNVYGFIFWNANPKVNYNNIYSNTKYGVYRTTLGNLTGALDARYNWWSDATGPHHPTLNPSGLGNDVSDYITFAPWLLQEKIPPLVHNIAVISVVPNATAVCAGDIVRIEVTVKNQGNTYETFSVVAYYDSIPINTQTVTDLIPGTNVILTFDWNTAGISPGEYTIKANASIVPGEIDILDNQVTDGIVRILCHNIAVTAVETFKTACGYTYHPFNIVYANYSVSINATVENQGDFPETFDVTAKYDDHIIGTIEVTLAAHTSTYVTFTWDTHGVARGSYNIAVEAVLPTDADLGDNKKTYGPVKVTWLGDSDGDFDVDEDDLWDFCTYFIIYYTPGKGYMARSIPFDFDENCKINEDDLWTFCAAFNNYYKWT